MSSDCILIGSVYGTQCMLGYDHWAATVSFAVMPPLLLPLYFNFEIPYYMISRKQWAVSNGFIDPTPPTFPTQQ